jgi:glycosyltransferase involved in cell wall biosynthesis
VEKEAATLAKNGHSVRVLAWDRSYYLPLFETKENYTINRIRIKASYGNLWLIPKLFFWNFKELIYLLREEYDVIHACDFDTLIPAVIASKIKNKKLVFDSYDFYADCLPYAPYWIRNIVAHIEIFFAKYADFTILVDESRMSQYKNRLKDIIIINNTPSDEKLAQIQIEMKEHTNREETRKFKIFYAGILDKNRGFEQMLNAIKEMSDVELTVAGFGADEIELKELFKMSENVKFIGKINYDEVLRKSVESDLLFALYNPKVPNHKFASPNKLFEAMMCGKPIIVSEDTTMAKAVRTEGCGIVVPYGDITAIRDTIFMLKGDQKMRDEMGQRGIVAYHNKYNWKIMEKRIINEYQKLDICRVGNL